MQKIFTGLLAVFFLVSGGCVSGEHRLQLTPAYYAENRIAVGTKLFQPGVLYTTEAEDDFVYCGPAQSYLGRKATLHIPIGQTTRAVAQKVLSAKFKKEITVVHSLTGLSLQNLIIHPTVTEYKYIIRWGFTGLNVIPQIDMVLKVDLLAPDHRVLFSRKYRSGIRTGEAFLSGDKAPDAINKLTHETIFNLMQHCALDLENILEEIN